MTSKQRHIKILKSHRFLSVLILLVIFSLKSNAQFVKVNIDIPAATSVEGLESFVMKPLTRPKTGTPELLGFAEFSISAAENMHVLVQVQPEPTMLNQVQLKTSIAWRNDGRKTIPADHLFINNKAGFPLSNTGPAGKNWIQDESLFLAWVFITVQADIPAKDSIINDQIIKLNIEYN